MRLFLPELITINCCSVFQLAHRAHTFFSQQAVSRGWEKNKNIAVINAFDWLWSCSGAIVPDWNGIIEGALSIKCRATDQPNKAADCGKYNQTCVQKCRVHWVFFQSTMDTFGQMDFDIGLDNALLEVLMLQSVCSLSCVTWSPGSRMRSSDHMRRGGRGPRATGKSLFPRLIPHQTGDTWGETGIILHNNNRDQDTAQLH